MSDSRLSGRALSLLVLAAFIAMGLAACGDRMSDLREYVNQVKEKKGGRIEPLPQLKPFETYTYADQDLRSPFTAQLQTFSNVNQSNQGTSKNGIHPDFNRNREHLEQYPLDGLKMMGTLTINGTLFGLVQDSDRNLNRVTVGNHMGQNYGKIISITDNEIKLQEIVPDGQGGWEERVTSLQAASQ